LSSSLQRFISLALNQRVQKASGTKEDLITIFEVKEDKCYQLTCEQDLAVQKVQEGFAH